MKNLFNGIPKSRIVKDFLLAVLVSVLNCTFTYVMSFTMDLYTSDKFMKFIITVFITVASFALAEFVHSYHKTLTSCHIENGVYKYYLNQLYAVKPNVLKKNNTGYIAGLLNKIVGRQEQAYQHVVCGMPIDIAYLLYFAIILTKLNWKLSLSAVITCVTGASFRAIVKRRIHPYGDAVGDSEGNRTKLFTESISNIETVQKMSAIDFINIRSSEINNKCIKAWRNWALRDELSNALGKLITFSFGPLCLLVLYSMDKWYLSVNTTLLALVIAVSTQMPHNAKSFARTVAWCCRFRDTAARLESIIVDENKRKPSCCAKFDSAYLYNAEHTYLDEENGVNITIKIPEFLLKRGKKICITGASGQGKTTLLNILAGDIESDNIVINNNPRGSKRLDCIFISQDVEIFDMSLWDNLSLGNPNASKVKAEYLLRMVGMKEWFDSVGCNWDVPLGERGVFVSTGQRQRLNLVRGLLNNSKEVYLLDEPTSNVDSDTEAKMTKVIAECLRDKTVVIVTHRQLLSSICDYAYHFTDGVLGPRKEIEH